MCGKRLDLAGIQLGHLTVLEATDHVIVIAETRLMFHTKLWCMAISKAVAAKKENMKANLAPI